MLEHARYGHILINDSDIRVPADYLAQVMENFEGIANSSAGKRIGMVTCLYRAVPGRTAWSKLEALAWPPTSFLAR